MARKNSTAIKEENINSPAHAVTVLFAISAVNSIIAYPSSRRLSTFEAQ